MYSEIALIAFPPPPRPWYPSALIHYLRWVAASKPGTPLPPRWRDLIRLIPLTIRYGAFGISDPDELSADQVATLIAWSRVVEVNGVPEIDPTALQEIRAYINAPTWQFGKVQE